MANWQESIRQEWVDSYEELGLGTTDPPSPPPSPPQSGGEG
jgi:hypothetical protein